MTKFGFSFLLAFCLAFSAHAQAVAPIETSARQAFLVDATTGTTLYEKNADDKMPTSSMSKMLTAYLVFEAIKNHKINKDDTMQVSQNAWQEGQGGSSMFLNVGQDVAVQDLIRGLIIQSGNDAAVVLAEGLGHTSEADFVQLMNEKAQQLGMAHSHFMNAAGLPDPQHYSTAHDLATLALALIHDFPDEYPVFSETEFSYNGIKQGNRNPLLYRNMNVDGLKTGHTDIGGYGLTVSALRQGRRLVLVLNGLESMQSRADESAKLLDWGYREYGLYPIAKAGTSQAEAKVWLGQAPSVALTVGEDVQITLPRSARASLKAVQIFDQPVRAPIKKGDVLGKLEITATGFTTRDVPLIAAGDVQEAGLFDRIWRKLKFLLGSRE